MSDFRPRRGAVEARGAFCSIALSTATGTLDLALRSETRLRLEAASVALTAVGIAVGLLAPPSLAAAGWSAAYLAGGWRGAVAAATELTRARVDIDLLMILAALGALVVDAPLEGATLLFLFSLSNLLQDVATARSRDAIRGLMELRPEVARVRRGDDVVPVRLEEVEVGEVYLLDPGDRVPLDGEVVRGRSDVDQSSLTGESIPVGRGVGDVVLAGTMNGGGALDVRVQRRVGDSQLSRMIALVEEAQSEKAETQQIIDRWEQPYALAVIALTVAAVAIPVLALGRPFDTSFYRAMTLMVAASPCALVISTPAAVLSGIAAGARSGVLFKGGVFIESFAGVRAIAFDKTGTLTTGRTELVDISRIGDVAENDLLDIAAAVQRRSEHHLARATVEAAEARGLEPADAAEFRAVAGRGVQGRVGGEVVRIGNPDFFDAPHPVGWDDALRTVDRLREAGRTAVVVARGAQIVGVMGFADGIRPGAAQVVSTLREAGIEEIALLTGDHASVAARVGAEVGIDLVRAELLPEAKVEAVRRLREDFESVAMVGDGVNDAPALATATIGVAMGGAGTDVALESADLVLMSDDLSRLPWALELSRRTRRVLVQNLVFAFGMILLMVVTILTVGLPLPLAVVGHEGSTVLVALNGLRLLGTRTSGGTTSPARTSHARLAGGGIPGGRTPGGRSRA